MSEATASSPPAGKGKGKKLFGMDRTTLIIVGVGLAVGVAWYLYKRSKANTPAATAGIRCTDASGNPGTTDASGNCIGTSTSTSDGVDTSGELSAMQTELESLLAQEGTGTDAGAPGPAGTPGTPGTPGSPGTPGTGTVTQVKQYDAPPGLRGAKKTATSLTLSWSPPKQVPAPISYTVAIYQLNGKEVHQQVVAGTSVTVSGLHPGWCYTCNVWANRGGPGTGIQGGNHSSVKVCV